jgi:hypothetical protein
MRWLLAIALFSAACRGNPEKCEKAVRHYHELLFWQQADAEIAAAPPDQREALRKKKLDQYNAETAKGLKLVTTQCVSATGMSDTQVDCMIAAKTADAAKACSD